jgi:serine/threonine protein kinase
VKIVGRYAVYDEVARGGMASVHLGRLLGAGGFSRTVAVKRLHPHLARDGEFLAMLLDEARLVSRIQHPNVVSVLDVVADDDQVAIVMDFVDGAPLSALLKASAEKKELVPPSIAIAVVINALRGLHAAHEAVGEDGKPLGLVHRDVTPHNVMVRRDGTAVVLDFGVAKAAGRFHTTEEGKVKGKLPYMAPEQLRGQPLTRKVDVYAAGAMLWETMVGRRLFAGSNEGEVLEQILFGEIHPPSALRSSSPTAIDGVVMKALSRSAADRYASAAELADALERAFAPAMPSQVATWLEGLAKPTLDKIAARIRAMDAEHAAERIELPQRVRDALKRTADAEPDTRMSSALLDASPVTGATPPTSSNALTRMSLHDDGSIASGALAKAAAAAVPPRKATRPAWLWALAILPVGAAAAWFMTQRPPPGELSQNSGSPRVASTAETPPPIATPPPVANASAAPSASAAATPSAAAVASASAEPAHSESAHPVVKVPRAGGHAHVRPPCSTVDAEGHRSYSRDPDCKP